MQVLFWNQIWIQRQVGWTFKAAQCTCSSLWSHCTAPYRLPWWMGDNFLQLYRTIMKFCFRLSFYLDNCAVLADLTICWESASWSLPVLLSYVLVQCWLFFWHICADFFKQTLLLLVWTYFNNFPASHCYCCCCCHLWWNHGPWLGTDKMSVWLCWVSVYTLKNCAHLHPATALL